MDSRSGGKWSTVDCIFSPLVLPACGDPGVVGACGDVCCVEAGDEGVALLADIVDMKKRVCTSLTVLYTGYTLGRH